MSIENHSTRTVENYTSALVVVIAKHGLKPSVRISCRNDFNQGKSLDFFLPAFLCIPLWGSHSDPMYWHSPCILLRILEVKIYSLKTVLVTFPWDLNTRFFYISPKLRRRTMIAFDWLAHAKLSQWFGRRNNTKIFLEQVFVFWGVEGVHKFPETLWNTHVYRHVFGS